MAALDEALADGLPIDIAFIEPAIGEPGGDTGLLDPDRGTDGSDRGVSIADLTGGVAAVVLTAPAGRPRRMASRFVDRAKSDLGRRSARPPLTASSFIDASFAAIVMRSLSRTCIRIFSIHRTYVGILVLWVPCWRSTNTSTSDSTTSWTRSPDSSTLNTPASSMPPPDCPPTPGPGRSPVSTRSSSTCAGAPGSAPPTPTRSLPSPDRVDELPECFAIFQRGELSLDQMTAIVAKTPAWADHRVAELAPMLTVRQLRRTLGKYRFPDSDRQPTRRPNPTEPVEAASDPVEEPVGHPARTIRVGSGSVTTAGSTCISTATRSAG